MLISMTGHGQGLAQCGQTQVVAELRAVNNRHLKIQSRISDEVAELQPALESILRSGVRRGALQLQVVVQRESKADAFQIQEDVVAAYHKQAAAVASRLGVDVNVSLGQLLALPGTVIEAKRVAGSELSKEMIAATHGAVEEAVKSLNAMREKEGSSMACELEKQLTLLGELTDTIEKRASAVVADYQVRLRERIAAALGAQAEEVAESDLTREIVLMADKSDVREELVRIRSHFQQFADLIAGEGSQGRKLDFLIQEMVREANTIGSKANDATIAQRVVDLKTTIEQMRELIQNVE
ncbi:MAG: YicC family protein [Aureliella sp.]